MDLELSRQLRNGLFTANSFDGDFRLELAAVLFSTSLQLCLFLAGAILEAKNYLSQWPIFLGPSQTSVFIRSHHLVFAVIMSLFSVPTFGQPTAESQHLVDVYIAEKAHEYHNLERAAQDSFDDKRYSEAISLAKQGLELQKKYSRIDGRWPILVLLQAECLIRLGSVDEALKLLDTKGSGICGDILASERAIELRIRRKEFDKALEDCEFLKNVTYDPTGNYSIHKSEVYEAMGDRAKALSALQEVYDDCIKSDSETSIVRQRFYDLNSKPIDNPQIHFENRSGQRQF